MTPPRAFYRVEWRAARRFDTPADRVDQARNFTSPSGAAAQIRSVLLWPTHCELVGVWRTGPSPGDDLTWAALDPDDLVAEYLGDDDRGRFDTLSAAWQESPKVCEAILAATDPEEGQP